MDQTNSNQHYISEVLLKRFRLGSERLQCFQVKTGEWLQRSTRDACSAKGWNQILVGPKADHTIENEFCKVESKLPESFAFLEAVSSSQSALLPTPIRENIRDYCSFLMLISPVAKPGAVVAMLAEINMGIEQENYYLLRELGVSEEAILFLRSKYLEGGRVIIEAENAMQLMFRHQFDRLLPSNRHIFDNTNWHICNSQVEIPLSDVGLIPIHLETHKANQFILPISPRLVLEGIFYFDSTKNISKDFLKRVNYTSEEAEYRLECICASAVEEVICSQRIDAIPLHIKRARENKIFFHNIVNPQLAKVSGQLSANPEFGLKIVNVREYVEVVHSYMRPTSELVEPTS